MSQKLVSSLVLMLLMGVTSLPVSAANPTSRVVDGVAIYLGVVPAGIVRGHPGEHPESIMHGGTVTGDQHIMIALFDDKSGKRIADAEVYARVKGPKRFDAEKRLEPMLVASAPSYGNYFSPYAPGSYRISVRIRLPGGTQDIRAAFTWTLAGSDSSGHL
jgi:hypothetical protein